MYRLLVCAVIAWGCSIEVNQSPGTPTRMVDPGLSATSSIPETRLPLTWSHLNLTGKLIYLSSTTDGDTLTSHIQMLDLATGTMRTIFSISSAWIYYAATSPDGTALVLSYSPPRQSNSPSVRSLYLLPLAGSSQPQPLFTPPTPADRYTQAEWSPDGKYIYYVHYNQEDQAEGQLIEDYQTSRMFYPNGGHQEILTHAFWPRLSPDSSELVYVAQDPNSGSNELYLANTDGSGAKPIPLSGSDAPEIIDAPLFLPDGQSVLFSAPAPSRSHQPGFVERLFGIQLAYAHNVPSDWWSVSLAGGVPNRLTNLQTINLFASLSPDRQHIASLSGEGIFVMDVDGSNLTQVVVDSRVHGTVSWIP